MTWPLLLSLYGVVAAYAALTYFLGEIVPLATIVLGFGILIIPYKASGGSAQMTDNPSADLTACCGLCPPPVVDYVERWMS